MTTTQQQAPGTHHDRPVLRPRAAGWALAALAGLAGVAGVLGGCNIVGPAVYFAVGPDKIKPVYTLDPAKTTVVFLDDRSSRIPSRATRELIGQTAEEELLNKGVVKDMVQSRRIQAVVARERYGKPLGIAQVGRAVEADVVIYCWVDEFTFSTDGQSFAPGATLRVKVVDAHTKERLFPAPEIPDGWHILRISPPTQQGSAPATTSERAEAERNLARWVGREIAGMFYERDPSTLPKKLGEDAP